MNVVFEYNISGVINLLTFSLQEADLHLLLGNSLRALPHGEGRQSSPSGHSWDNWALGVWGSQQGLSSWNLRVEGPEASLSWVVCSKLLSAQLLDINSASENWTKGPASVFLAFWFGGWGGGGCLFVLMMMCLNSAMKIRVHFNFLYWTNFHTKLSPSSFLQTQASSDIPFMNDTTFLCLMPPERAQSSLPLQC